MKKIIALIIVLSLITSVFCGCNKSEENPDDPQVITNLGEIGENSLRLAYSKADTLDPFTASMSANIQVLGLIYDGLYKLDKTYNPIPVIAKSSIVSGTTINITINDVWFSDGSVLTPGDILYSFNKAKESPHYAERLRNFISASVSSSNMLVFTLESSDPYALACLTFPVVKNGSEGDLPVGSGRYSVKTSGETTYLVVNTKKSGFNPVIKTITLVPVRDSESVESSLEIGNTGFFYNDLSSGSYSRINAKTVGMGINNFVYLAFNSSSEIFSNPLIRQAVNLAVNRNEITSTAFQAHARATYSPFNPDWHMLASKDLIIPVDTAKAQQLIAQSGIDITQKEVSILVNKENGFKLETAEFIANYLRALGFNVILKNYEPQYYTEAIGLGSYDMYIGEIKLTANMDLTPLLGGSQGYGINPECSSVIRYNQLLGGGCELMDFINTFNEDLPFIPICYRNGAASYTNSMNADFNCCDNDVFYDIETWSFK